MKENAVAQHVNVWKKRHLVIKAAQAEFQPIREEEVLAWAALIARWSFCHRSTCLAVPLTYYPTDPGSTRSHIETFRTRGLLTAEILVL